MCVRRAGVLSSLAFVLVLGSGSGSLLYASGSDVYEAIRKVRMGTLVVEATPGVEVRVEQLRHEFWFGSALAGQAFGGRMNAADAAQYKKVFLENFNAGVTEVALQNALAKLAQFNLPIRITEFNFPGQRSKYYGQRGVSLSEEEEKAKAKALADYYRICFAQPVVKGILMWGFWEGANWIPVSSLYRRDWSPTPAADA